MTSFPLCLPLRSPTGRRFPPQVVCSPKCRLLFDETQRRAAGMHRSPGAQRRRQRADRAEEGAVLGILKAVFAERDPELVRELYQLAIG